MLCARRPEMRRKERAGVKFRRFLRAYTSSGVTAWPEHTRRLLISPERPAAPAADAGHGGRRDQGARHGVADGKDQQDNNGRPHRLALERPGRSPPRRPQTGGSGTGSRNSG